MPHDRDIPDLMSVLAPAAPPVARNARVITGVGLTKPADTAPRGPKPDRRRAIREARKTSLWIAAGFK